MAISTADGTVEYLNRSFTRILGYDLSDIPTVEEWWRRAYPDEAYRRQAMERWAQTTSENAADNRHAIPPEQTEYTVTCKDGSRHYMDIQGAVIHEKLFVVLNDITERKRAEGMLRTSLAEKEVLLREIHHRVKNNLQVISSLLELQSRSVADSSLRQLLRVSLQRVKSIAMVHEHLYQSEDMAHINLARYIEGLSRYLQMAFLGTGQQVSLQLELAPVSCSIDTAVPCGLIVNELVANALKHAFPDGRKGEIRIILRQADGQKLVLEVADNGIGWPKELSSAPADSLGMTLVDVLTRQLKGRLEILQDGGGAGVRLTFDNPYPPGNRPSPT